ncbi:MAG TPA: efflux RND transporter periplasmic adaptor subunit [Candidatus Paceibacterota bacterium]|nr:efflux RND transporter periplasmic adaptor subunit [Candidatus Paceibacterota bacterium]
MKTFFAKHIVPVVVAGVAVLSVAGAWWYVAANQVPSFAATEAARGDVVESLNEPVTVLAEDNSALSFQEAGQIAQVEVSDGDTVAAGTVLASLSSDALQASVDQANAALAAAQAKLDELQGGTRPEELAVDQAAVASAQASLGADVGNAYTAADDAVRNQTDNMFTNAQGNNPTFLVPVTDSQTLNDIGSGRVAIEATLDGWYAALNGSSTASSSLAGMADGALSQVQSYLDLLALAVNDATPGSVNAATLSGYKVDISTARTEVGAAITALTGAESGLTAAQSALTLAQAGSQEQDIEAQQAAVAQAQAAAASAQVALRNATLAAPFPGTVQDVTAQVGQVVSPGVPVLSLVNNSGLKLQAYVSEADVAKIRTGQAAQVTLDAFGTGTDFAATVTTVANAETQVDGTPSYLVTLHFTQSQPQVKDGMTGNAKIILAEHDGVVAVPSRLVISDGNQYFVLVATATGTVERPVEVGLTGDDGMTEITSGINEGDQLANF